MNPAFITPAAAPGRVVRPLFGSHVPAGFPSPADDYVEDRLDLNELLIQHREATYFLRELTAKRLRFRNGAPELHPENPAYPVIRFREGQELRI